MPDRREDTPDDFENTIQDRTISPETGAGGEESLLDGPEELPGGGNYSLMMSGDDSNWRSTVADRRAGVGLHVGLDGSTPPKVFIACRRVRCVLVVCTFMVVTGQGLLQAGGRGMKLRTELMR